MPIPAQGVQLKVGDFDSPEVFRVIAEITDFDGPSGQLSIIDTSHLGSNVRQKLSGLLDEGQWTFSMNLVPGNSPQFDLHELRQSRTLTNFRVELTDSSPGTEQGFSAYVTQFSISGAVDDKVMASCTLEIVGLVDWDV